MLTILRRDENRPNYSVCLCSCGKEKVVRTDAAKSGRTKSCGCHKAKTSAENGKGVTTHGKTGTKEYRRWLALKAESHIPVCEEWQRFEPYWEFIKEKWENGYHGITFVDGATEINKDTIILTTSEKAKRKNAICTLLSSMEALSNEN